MSFPYLGETKELNEVTRKEAGGSFAALPNGVTHYEMAGPENGQPVVFVHGFSVPCFIFDPTFSPLANAGFRAIRYDLFGRGYSDRPHAKYNIDLFVNQLADLLNALRLGQVDLIGLSMGGPITTAFTDKHPERVRKHVLIDPAGVRAVALSSLLKAVELRYVGELLLGLFGSETMIKGAASDFFSPALIEEFRARYAVQMQYRGFKRAILSSIRSGMLGSFYEYYLRVGRLRKPTLLFWGKDDTTVPFEYSNDLLAAMPHATLHAVEKSGHIPHYEKPGVINPILEKFLGD